MSELSKWMTDGVTVDHKKVLLKVINHVTHTKHRGLILAPKMSIDDARLQLLIMKGQSDSNHVTNPETRKITRGMEVTLNSAAVVMRSAGQIFLLCR